MKVQQKTAPKNVVTVRKHYVTFYSPGTFFTESTMKPIPDWDTKVAVEMSKKVLERHNAKPYAFRFSTMLEAEPVDDGEGGMLKVEPKEVEDTGLFFLGGTLRNIDEIRKKADKEESILLSNMEGNDYPIIIENRNSWRFTGPFSEKDCIVDDNGDIIKRGDDSQLMEYRKEKTEEKRVRDEKSEAEWQAEEVRHVEEGSGLEQPGPATV